MQAETAKDALELLADTHVDVLFTDIELPGGMNGTELAEAAHEVGPEHQGAVHDRICEGDDPA